MKPKKVLMITYRFLPFYSPSAQRVGKFAKYLPQFGWEPYILTSGPGTDRVEKLAGIGNGLRVIRAREIIDTGYDITRPRQGRSDSQPVKKPSFPKELVRRLKGIVKRCTFIPDEHFSWIPSAVIKGWRLIQKEHIDAIFSSSPPPSGHVVALILKILTRKPWVADFRDPWPYSRHYLGADPPSRWALTRVLERICWKKSDRKVFVSDTWAKTQAEVHGYGRPGKCDIIYNGADRQEYEKVSRVPDKGFTITYTGNFYDTGRTPDNFFTALSEVYRSDPSLRSNLRFLFLGYSWRPIADLAAKLGLTDCVCHMGAVAFDEVIKYQRNADALLFVNHSLIAEDFDPLPAKIFEYIAADRPIIALTPDGNAKEMLSKYAWCYFAHPSSVQEIKEAILKAYEEREDERRVDKELFFQLFDRKCLTEQLANILNQIVNKQ